MDEHLSKGGEGSRASVRLSLIGITQEFDLDRLVGEGVLAEEGRRAVEAVSRRTVLVEEISSQKDKVDLHEADEMRSQFDEPLPMMLKTDSGGLTSYLTASSRISLNVLIASWPRTGSRSMYPMWLSVASMILMISSDPGERFG